MRFLRAVVLMIGAILGLGILGMPYVFSRAGFWVGLFELLFIGAVLTVIYIMFGEITREVRGRHRTIGYLIELLGSRFRLLVSFLFIISLFGAMLPFLILSGQLLNSLFGLPPLAGVLIMFALGAFFIWGGLSFISKLELLFIGLLTLAYFLLIVFTLPYFQVENIVSQPAISTASWRPIGVILYALGGLGIIPEVHDLLGRRTRRMTPAIILAMIFLVALYAVFSLVVIGALGSDTSQHVLGDLAAILPAPIGVLGLIIGIVSGLSIFTVLGLELVGGLTVDFHLKKFSAWVVTLFVPLALYLLGARELTAVMGFVGGLFGGLFGLLVLAAYRHTAPPRLFPLWVVYPLGVIYLLAVAAAIGYNF